MKKLYRSMQDKMIGGVLGGFAEYINIDSTLVRLGYVLLGLILCVPFLLFYIICWIVIPKNPTHSEPKKADDTKEVFTPNKTHSRDDIK